MLNERNAISKTQPKGFGEDYPERAARKEAEAMTERFNEPAHLLETPRDWLVVRHIAWRARDTWGAKDVPADAKHVEMFLPSDRLRLKSEQTKAKKLSEKIQARSMDAMQKDRFDLEWIMRDYPEVRRLLDIYQKQAESLYNVAIFLNFAVTDALDDHKKNGQPKNRHLDED